MASNAQIQQQITELVSRWRTREEQFGAWVAGPADGGPNSDGRYPLGTALGEPALVESPSKLADMVSGPAADAAQARDDAQQAAADAVTARDRVVTGENQVIALRADTGIDRGLAKQYRDEAANFASQASSSNTSVTSLASQVSSQAAQVDEWTSDVLAARDVTLEARDDAVTAAQAAESFAESINPALFVGFGDLNNAIADIIGNAPTALDTLQELADALGNDPNFATTVTNQIAGKADSVHGHSIGDVAGLQTALNGKANSSHTHTISQVSGLQSTLDGKITVGEFGVGTSSAPNVPNGDLSSSVPGGFYRVASGTANMPSGVNSGATAYSAQWNDDNWSRILVDGGGSSPSAPARVFVRARNSGTVKNWQELWHSANFDPDTKFDKSGGSITGNVGIGTTSPERTLDVAGDASFRDAVVFEGGTGSDSLASFRIKNGGSHIVRSEAFSGIDKNIRFRQSVTDTANQHFIISQLDIADRAISFNIRSGRSTITSSTNMVFSTGSTLGGAAERMRITSAGNVGIGTTSPSERLSVVGNISLSGTILAGGTDVVATISNLQTQINTINTRLANAGI